jgi:hypothetical protein
MTSSHQVALAKQSRRRAPSLYVRIIAEIVICQVEILSLVEVIEWFSRAANDAALSLVMIQRLHVNPRYAFRCKIALLPSASFLSQLLP